MVTQTWWVNVSLEKLWKRILHGGNWGGGGTRGLPLVDGRSGKHAPSWQTQSWSWRAGCAPGDCLCASDGRGADYHHHSACHRVLRGKKTEGANASPGDSYEKGRQTTSSRHLEKRRRRRRRPTPLPPHNPSPTRPINPTHTWCHPSGLNCPPTPPETHRGRSRKTPARPALPLSDAL